MLLQSGATYYIPLQRARHRAEGACERSRRFARASSYFTFLSSRSTPFCRAVNPVTPLASTMKVRMLACVAVSNCFDRCGQVGDLFQKCRRLPSTWKSASVSASFFALDGRRYVMVELMEQAVRGLWSGTCRTSPSCTRLSRPDCCPSRRCCAMHRECEASPSELCES